MRLADGSAWLFGAGALFASLAACAGKEASDTNIASGPCETAGQTAACLDDAKVGTQNCLTSLAWSVCVPPGKTANTLQPECTLGDKQTCDLGSGFRGAMVCVVAGSGAAIWTDCCGGQSTIACTTSDGQAGVAICSGGEVQSGCGVVDGCDPSTYDNSSGCVLAGNLWESAGGGDTPLILAFDDERVAFTNPRGDFDFSGRDASFATSWVSAETPWLAVDRNGNGRIDDGSELFGSMTELPGGERAPNGFVALAALDDDGDGAITPRDAAFDRLVLWSDSNQDRRSTRDEILSAGQAGLVAIRLDYRDVPRCLGADCEVERARFVFRDGDGVEREGSVVDVHLAQR